MTQDSYEHYRPQHSDFLVPWTGEPEIEDHCRACKMPKDYCNPYGAKGIDSTTCTKVTQLYLDRLKSILKHGLWMTEAGEDERPITIKGTSLGLRPKVARTCFTELKLSEVRAHASRYGRLGIGFKRPFVMERGGLPVLYHPFDWVQWAKSIWGEGYKFKGDELYTWFLKEMGDRYEYLNESEWRIICTDWLIKKV